MVLFLKDFARCWTEDLRTNVVPFWLSHSIDRECGGYFTRLGRTGKILSGDRSKYHWLQGRAVWTFSILYLSSLEILDKNCREKCFEAAKNGAKFLKTCKKDVGNKTIYVFQTDREGSQVLKHQRTPYTAVFYAMGNIAFYRALLARAASTPPKYADDGEPSYFWKEAVDAFDYVVRAMNDPIVCGKIVRDKPSSSSSASVLGEVMCLAMLADEFLSAPTPPSATANDRASSWTKYIQIAVDASLSHFDPKNRVFVEHVSADGRLGSLCNPGHSIEVSWCVLRLVERYGSSIEAATRLQATSVALDALEGALEVGWDTKHGDGGIVYFVDLEDRPLADATVTAEDKLWWPHCEALIALTFAYRSNPNAKWIRWLKRVHAYAYTHFCDRDGGGEWWGYLRRDSTVFNACKGGNYKGFFHVPRALLYASRAAGVIARESTRRLSPGT